MAIAVGGAIRIGNKAPAFESLAESAAGHAQELDHYSCGDLASWPRNAGIPLIAPAGAQLLVDGVVGRSQVGSNRPGAT